MGASANRHMVISSLWLQVAIVTFLVGFAVLLYLAYRIHAEPPPIPGRVVAQDGSTLFTGATLWLVSTSFRSMGLCNMARSSVMVPTWGRISRPSICTKQPVRWSLFIVVKAVPRPRPTN